MGPSSDALMMLWMIQPLIERCINQTQSIYVNVLHSSIVVQHHVVHAPSYSHHRIGSITKVGSIVVRLLFYICHYGPWMRYAPLHRLYIHRARHRRGISMGMARSSCMVRVTPYRLICTNNVSLWLVVQQVSYSLLVMIPIYLCSQH